MFNDMNSDDDARSEDLDDDTRHSLAKETLAIPKRLDERRCSYQSSTLCYVLFGAVQAQFPGKPLRTPLSAC